MRTPGLAVALVCMASHAAVAQQRAPDFGAFDAYVEKAARDWKAVGLGIAVVKDDSLVFAKGYGAIEIGKPARVDVHTRFAIGSTTKAMTSAALAMLVDEGKLRWDDRVTDYVPELRLYDPYASHEVTIRDLLTHRTGLPATDLFWAVGENEITFPEVIHRLRFIPPSTSFRSTWNYQNVVYAIGGTLVERASGMSWDAFIRSRIFAPLGMNESEALVSQIRGKGNVAVPHADIRDTVRVVPMRSTDLVAPAGSVWSSVSDMSKWMRFVLDSGRVGTKRLISEANFRELVAPQMRVPMDQYPALALSSPHVFSYALGWFVQDYHGQTVWMHTGSIDGMSAIIGLMPAQRVGVFMLGNLDHIELRHALMYAAFDLYGDGPKRDWSADLLALFASKRPPRPTIPAAPHVAVGGPSVPLEKYTGTFADPAYGSIIVTSANGVLSARYDKIDVGVLDHWDYDVFRSSPKTPLDDATALAFQSDGNGSINAVRAFGVTFVRRRQ